ncbi:O-antigen ligase family protein [Micromonospora sp. NPDC050187]|uniref:O-antigen ligase family protein n=1 Tax=Micromonospora sp. NPDC050187 TaxID=3364277 RepID=UPI0037B56AAA
MTTLRGRITGGLRRATSRQPVRWTDAGIALLVVLAWLRGVAPPLVQLLDSGRPGFNTRTDLMPVAGRLLGDALTLAVVGLAVVLAGYGLRRGRPDHWWGLLVALVPLAVIASAGWAEHQPPGPVTLALPLVAVAVWVCRPGRRVLATIGACGALTALGSMLLAAARPELALLTGAAAGAKSVPGGLLAGPYAHSNVLGIVLALSLPFVFALRTASSRWTALAVMLVAVAWTGSRTSQVAVLAVLAAGALLAVAARRGWRSRRSWSVLVSLPVAAGLALTVVTPLLTTDPARFTERGRIWRELLTHWRERPLLGHGPDFFYREPGLAEALGGAFNHGHNLLVHLLVVGGLLAVVAVATLLGLCWRRAAVAARRGRVVPMLYLAAFVWVSWLEASHVPTTLAGHLSWLPLCLILRGEPERDSEDQGVPEVVGDPA